MRSALAYYDEQIDENHVARIFLEPPDEDNASAEETDDDEWPDTISKTNCEVILRSGKRIASETFGSSHRNAPSKRLKNNGPIRYLPPNSVSVVTTDTKRRGTTIVKSLPRRIVSKSKNLTTVNCQQKEHLSTVKARPRRNAAKARAPIAVKCQQKKHLSVEIEPEIGKGKHDCYNGPNICKQ